MINSILINSQKKQSIIMDENSYYNYMSFCPRLISSQDLFLHTRTFNCHCSQVWPVWELHIF